MKSRKPDPLALPASPPLAYKDEKFLDSDEARPIRILAEYLEPLRILCREQVHETIVFFGSARARRSARTLLPGGPRACAARHDLVEEPSVQCSPVRGLLGRWSRNHG